MVAEGETTGYVAVAIAVVFFGSNFVPVKSYDTGDGMFYQWVMCSAIFVWGLLVQLYLFSIAPVECSVSGARPDAYSIKFIPLAAFGGALWATGNTLSVPVINMIGLSLGLLIWGCTNMLTGWATGMYGLFGTTADTLEYPSLNYAGVTLALVALVLYTQIDAEGAVTVTRSRVASATSLASMDHAHTFSRGAELPEEALLAPERAAYKRPLGVGLAMIAGVFFGNTFTPPTFLMHNQLGPANPLDYVFSHFCGIYAASTLCFVVYFLVAGKETPPLYPRIVIPGLLSGLMWAIAQTCWFVANDALSLSVAFPIITSGPGVISAVWGVFVFREISGKRNFVVLGTAIALTVVGCALIGVSKGGM